MAVGDMTPFWEAVVRRDHQTIVHAGREEMVFCLQAVGQPPSGCSTCRWRPAWSATNIRPASARWCSRSSACRSAKHETRTDWRRRPLSKRQIEYALDDVLHLQPLRELLEAA